MPPTTHLAPDRGTESRVQPIWQRMLNWLADAAGRSRRTPCSADRGMTRRKADRAFHTRGGNSGRERVYHSIPRW